MKLISSVFLLSLVFMFACGVEVEKNSSSDFENRADIDDSVEYYAGLISNTFSYVVINGKKATLYYTNSEGEDECYQKTTGYLYTKTDSSITLWQEYDNPSYFSVKLTSYWKSNYANFKESVINCEPYYQ